MAIMDQTLDRIGPELADVVSAATNSAIQAIAKELARHGLKGGLGDDRELRTALEPVVQRAVAVSVLVRLTRQTAEATADADAARKIPNIRGKK